MNEHIRTFLGATGVYLLSWALFPARDWRAYVFSLGAIFVLVAATEYRDES